MSTVEQIKNLSAKIHLAIDETLNLLNSGTHLDVVQLSSMLEIFHNQIRVFSLEKDSEAQHLMSEVFNRINNLSQQIVVKLRSSEKELNQLNRNYSVVKTYESRVNQFKNNE